ncbi:MAG: ATP-binding cassette domain-containing protein [Actinobacteria bacterium]|nr:ATP-binding cassette domain-containing protein [Actinomycetota bacterium]
MIRTIDLGVTLGRTEVLHDLDLDLGAGVHGVLGPNGAGKTTLIRVLATTLRHDRGRVEVLGRSLERAKGTRWVRERIGYLPQSFGYHAGFTAREYVAYLAWLKRMPAHDVPLAVDRALERVDLLSRADTKLRKLSGGMLRRVGLAQAIVNDPMVLLLDEPTAGLDPEQRVAFRELLREIGVDACVIVSTHLVEDVAHACHDVMIMSEGRIVLASTAQELAALGADSEHPGDSVIERGYSAALRGARPPGTR